MHEKYFNFFYYIMKNAFHLVRRSKKKGMHVYRFKEIIIVCLNDFDNRRVVTFFYHIEKKIIHRICWHGYFVRELRRKFVNIVNKIGKDPTYFEEYLIKKNYFSYKKEKTSKLFRYKYAAK